MDNNQSPAPAQGQQVAKTTDDKTMITYKSEGQEVKLSFSIVRNFLVKGGGNVSDQDIVLFMNMCRFNQLNPFLNEANLVKYGTGPASMVVTKESFFKRAESCEGYDGIQAGIIIKRNGEVLEVEGSFYLPNDEILGGWAKVYRKDRHFPTVSKVAMQEYDKKQSIWKEKPATMICKIAKVQALREAFPKQFGNMYTEEEVRTVDSDYKDITPEHRAEEVNDKKEEIRAKKENVEAPVMP